MSLFTYAYLITATLCKCHGFLNHRQLDCFFSNLFSLTTKTYNIEGVSMPWCHYFRNWFENGCHTSCSSDKFDSLCRSKVIFRSIYKYIYIYVYICIYIYIYRERDVTKSSDNNQPQLLKISYKEACNSEYLHYVIIDYFDTFDLKPRLFYSKQTIYSITRLLTDSSLAIYHRAASFSREMQKRIPYTKIEPVHGCNVVAFVIAMNGVSELTVSWNYPFVIRVIDFIFGDTMNCKRGRKLSKHFPLLTI